MKLFRGIPPSYSSKIIGLFNYHLSRALCVTENTIDVPMAYLHNFLRKLSASKSVYTTRVTSKENKMDNLFHVHDGITQ
ncbi:hypothetical protein PR048_002626 [Dryococelus australis]|uniref:Uncharacterized protein n=1 Tax=Dryococelus australis TaxID=614101 RepID=A0ABQ9IM73_9NEOP|nr:hypothetical protein PR048_002626 [Dryococelus australis]